MMTGVVETGVPVEPARAGWLPWVFVALAVLSALLAVLGLVRTPAAFTAGPGPIALAGVILAQAACVAAAFLGPLSVRRLRGRVLAPGVGIGAVVGILYGAELSPSTSALR
jgi:hypothetical protein